jgi:hypothetical protein
VKERGRSHVRLASLAVITVLGIVEMASRHASTEATAMVVVAVSLALIAGVVFELLRSKIL